MRRLRRRVRTGAGIGLLRLRDARDVAVQDREYIRTWPTQLEQQVSVGSQRIVDIVSVETDY